METKLPTRKENRLLKFLYNWWWYFVTIITENRLCCLWKVVRAITNRPQYTEEEVQLNEFWKIVEKYWFEIPNIHNNVELWEFVVMPNHIHWIIYINESGKMISSLTIIEKPAGEQVLYVNEKFGNLGCKAITVCAHR